MAPPPFLPSSKVAAGNNNSAGLTSWGSIVVSGVPFIPPVVYGLFSYGQQQDVLDGSLYFNGYPESGIQWVCTQEQAYYLSVTFCNSGYWGLITIQMRSQSPSAYPIYNSVLKLDQLAVSAKKSMAFEPYRGRLTKLIQIG